MKKQSIPARKTPDLSRLDTAQLLLLVGEMQQQIDVLSQLNGKQSQDLGAAHQELREANKRILLLEEAIRLYKARKFAASSEKSTFQMSLFDEAEVEVELDELLDKLPEDKDEGSDLKQLRKERKPRNRAFSKALPRKRIELLLSEAEKQGASTTFFSKVKEELEYIPAQLTVLEYWQEKAVFEQADGSEQVLSAKRPVHPLGKCQASLALITQVIVGKYADGLPLHRQEAMFKRLGHEIRRGTMARWVVDLQPALMPLLQLYRDTQIPCQAVCHPSCLTRYTGKRCCHRVVFFTGRMAKGFSFFTSCVRSDSCGRIYSTPCEHDFEKDLRVAACR